MESETSKRNSHPTESSSLPTITLAVLLLTIVALLYIGYEYIADNTSGHEELTNVALDTTSQNSAPISTEPELVAPIEIDTSSRNAPVDLSQAEPPVEETVTTPASKPQTESASAEKKAETRTEAPKKEEKPKEEKPKEVKPEPTKVVIPAGGSSHTHTVKPGETIYSIATKYNMSIGTLKSLNPDLQDNAVKADVTKLKVKVRAVHTVGPGDILRVVAAKYGVSLEALMKANGKTQNVASRGERLIIPYPDKQ